MPDAEASWDRLNLFVSRKNYYGIFGTQKVLEIAKKVKTALLDEKNIESCTLTDLRIALYFLHKKYIHVGDELDEVELNYAKVLMEGIHEKVRLEHFN